MIRAIPHFILFILLSTSCFAADLCTGALTATSTTASAGFTSKQETNQKLAAAAGLVFFNKNDGVYTRVGDKSTGFTYVDSANQVVTDPNILARIKALRIPPAWHNVWVATNPKAHIQAGGLDDSAHPQTRYHNLWNTEVKDVAKFDRMSRFGKALPNLYAAIATDIAKPATTPPARKAAVVRLMEIAGIRIGGERYADENDHYGLTTLQVRHIAHVDATSTDFTFIGKEGKNFHIHVIDSDIARIVNASLNGKAPTDLLFDVSSSEVNQYLKAKTSKEFSAKDIRTWVGTLTATQVLLERGPPTSAASQQDAEKAAAVAASEHLGNTWTTARDNYIDPYIFDCYRNGKLFEASQKTGGQQVELALLSLLANKP